MLNRVSLYVVAVSLVVVFMVAGCAKQEIVKKDEGIIPAQATKSIEQSKNNTVATKQESSSVGKQAAVQPAVNQQVQKAPASSRLQSELETIYFDFDSASLSESTRSILSKNAKELMKDTSAKISIEGNCDDRGSAEYNLALGERRAKAAQQYLINLGMQADRLSTISYGKEKPAVHGSDEAAWAKNRRDEFVLSN